MRLKILDFSTLLPGPFASMILADLGAEVLRIEAPHRPDLLRHYPPMDGNTSAAHQALNRNKRSLALDLKQPEAIEIIEKLIMDYDILLEQFRPGVMERLGLGYDKLSAINPKLIYCSLTGYGQNGPYAQRAGHDINYLALSGLSSFTGTQTEGPRALGVQVADVGAGSMYSVIGILTAVIQRQQSGEGQHIDVSMLDGALSYASLQATEWFVGNQNPDYESNLLNGGTFYNNYRTQDGRYLSIGSLEPPFFKQLAEALELPGILEHPQHPKTIEAIRQRISEKSLAEWIEIFEKRDACVEPVLTMEEVEQHPQVQARSMIVNVSKPDGSSQKQIAHPIKFSKTQARYDSTGAQLGEHSVDVLTELGFSEEAIAQLQERGVIKSTEC